VTWAASAKASLKKAYLASVRRPVLKRRIGAGGRARSTAPCLRLVAAARGCGGGAN
jgi:hypothetical protein